MTRTDLLKYGSRHRRCSPLAALLHGGLPRLVFGVLVLAPLVAAAAREVPLVVRAEAQPLSPDTCGYWTALSLATGFDVRPVTAAQAADRAWEADADLEGETLRVRLKSPDGRLRADKSIPVRDPCADGVQVLAILLVVHVPAFELDVQRTQNPSVDAQPKAEVEAQAPLPNRSIRWLVAPNLVLLAKEPRYLISLGGEVLLGRLGFGLRLSGSSVEEKAGSGRIRVTELSSRLTSGYALVTQDPFRIELQGLAGARLDLGSSKGFSKNRRAMIPAAELGA